MKDDPVFLLQILEFIEKIDTYTQNGKEEFMLTPLIQDAVIRNFEIIGEAVKQVSDQIKKEHAEIHWREIAGFRDVLIHKYMGVDLDAVWNAVEIDLPILREKIMKILENQYDG
ncbi:HepT-like ribonuclease domain-containing protein [Methanospirillum sp.]|uniref:HepT-like ribonuclease domain-containing protein n=1 Tax=Methanospirillum sp. TaxID=45200 RepID=UPI001BD3131C